MSASFEVQVLRTPLYPPIGFLAISGRRANPDWALRRVVHPTRHMARPALRQPGSSASYFFACILRRVSRSCVSRWISAHASRADVTCVGCLPSSSQSAAICSSCLVPGLRAGWPFVRGGANRARRSAAHRSRSAARALRTRLSAPDALAQFGPRPRARLASSVSGPSQRQHRQ